MAEEKRIATGHIGNALRSTAADHTTTFADEIFDTERQQYQNEVNDIVGTYTENPEFAYVQTDNENKILYGVKTDGEFFFGAGCPQQVKDYIEEKISSLSLDEYEDIVAFLNDYLGSDTTLKVMIDSINERIPEIIENQEFIEVTTDSEDKVLEGIKSDGTKVISGDLNIGGSAKILGEMEIAGVTYKVVKNSEYLAVWVDAEGKIIFGFKADGKTYVGDADFLNDIKNNQGVINEIKAYLANLDTLDIDALSSIIVIENPEYIEAKTDSEGKLLAGRTPNGEAFEKVGFATPKASIDGHIIENIEDPEERTEILTDKDDKILSYRKKDGTKVEKFLEVENLTIQNPSTFISQMRAQGYDIAATDYSEAKELHIPEPRCARVNFTGIPDIPQAKFLDYKGYMEFWDMQGNYFKKEVIMNAQGRSTMGDAKKNIAIDICNNNGWDDGDTFKLQIGNWVSQDSFHLKAYMKDPFKCLGPISYAFHNEVVKTRGILRDYVWKRALIDTDAITSTSTGVTDEESKMQYTNGATCFPQCFPCIVYFNGEFYGIYSWQIKKHRDNYQMNKKEAKHVHLDNNVSTRLLYANGDASLINWNALDVYNQGLEIRNPKNLYLMNGSKYDEDFNAGELIDETSPYYDPANKDHIRSAKVKKYILDLSKVLPAMDAIATIHTNNGDIKLKNYQGVYNATDNFNKGVWVSDGNGSYYMSIHSTNTGNPLSDTNNWIEVTQAVTDIKQSLEEHWDIDNLIDYEIVSDIICNVDGFGDNWQWVTYDGIRWYICIYDTDMTFGYHQGNIITPRTDHLMKVLQYEYLLNFYQDKLDKRYAELRKLGLIDADHIIKLFEDWMNRLGNKDAYEKEWKKWSTPFFNDSIMRVYKWLKETIVNMDSVYNYNI